MPHSHTAFFSIDLQQRLAAALFVVADAAQTGTIKQRCLHRVGVFTRSADRIENEQIRNRKYTMFAKDTNLLHVIFL